MTWQPFLFFKEKRIFFLWHLIRLSHSYVTDEALYLLSQTQESICHVPYTDHRPVTTMENNKFRNQRIEWNELLTTGKRSERFHEPKSLSEVTISISRHSDGASSQDGNHPFWLTACSRLRSLSKLKTLTSAAEPDRFLSLLCFHCWNVWLYIISSDEVWRHAVDVTAAFSRPSSILSKKKLTVLISLKV